ncbi:MAG: hypothetical protein CFH10_00114 [Alphaproteobacteria bacterium MarineAlpha4_Bin2]|nr:MAG: hypothetical protein CFH10_00114 [Alphaproteobacteria bacterium MarineAlpha4_Bin2]
MPRKLTEDQITGYHQDGFCFPVEGIGFERAAAARRELEAYEVGLGMPLTAAGREERYKLHVRLPWACDLVRDPSILDAVEDIIGPNIFVWTSTFFIKEPGTTAITMWHQDATYFGLRPHAHITAWIALSEASEASGCMEFVPEGGKARLYRHRANADPKSINGGGQTIDERFDKGQTVRGKLKMGEFSLHHTLCAHSSPPNNSEDRRIGYGISYVPASVRHIGTTQQRAMLVRGSDPYGHFLHEPFPIGDDRRDADELAKSRKSYNFGYAEQIEWHARGRWDG